MTIELLNKVGASVCRYVGLSIDIKPTDCGYGSTFYEEDTGTPYLYATSGWVIDYRQLFKLIAGEAHVGEISVWEDLIVVTPAIGAAAFSANDFVGGKFTLTNAVRIPGGKGVVESLKLVDTSKQNKPLLIFIFGADLAGTYVDNTPEAVTAPDWLNWIGTIEVLASDYKSMASASLVDLSGMGMDVKAASGRNLFGLIVTTGTPTYGANALQLTLGMRGGN